MPLVDSGPVSLCSCDVRAWLTLPVGKVSQSELLLWSGTRAPLHWGRVWTLQLLCFLLRTLSHWPCLSFSLQDTAGWETLRGLDQARERGAVRGRTLDRTC